MARLRSPLAMFWLVLSVIASPCAIAQTNDCRPQGYLVAFFNGMNSKRALAKADAAALQKSLPLTYMGRPILVRLFYNRTNGLTSDLIEAYRQIADEADSTGALARRNDILLQAVRGQYGRLNALKNGASASVIDKIDKLVGQLKQRVAGGYIPPQTLSDYSQHSALILQGARSGYTVLLLGYSQGALFANQVYSYLNSLGFSNVGVAYIAPASQNLNGPYVLASGDKVIEALRSAGITHASTPGVTSNPDDLTGHSITATYLVGSARTAVVGMVTSSFSSLPDLACRVTYRYEGEAFDGSFQSALFPGRVSGTFQLNVPPGYNGTVTQADAASLVVQSPSGNTNFSQTPMIQGFSMTLRDGVPVAWRAYLSRSYSVSPSGVGTFLSGEYAEIISNGRTYNAQYFDIYGKTFDTYGLFQGTPIFQGSSTGLSGSRQLGRWSIVPTL